MKFTAEHDQFRKVVRDVVENEINQIGRAHV